MEEYLNKSKISGDIFRFLYLNKQSSRQEIAQSLGISLPTTTRNLNALQESGFIENAGEFQSTGGRKAIRYQCVANSRQQLNICHQIQRQQHMMKMLILHQLSLKYLHRMAYLTTWKGKASSQL